MAILDGNYQNKYRRSQERSTEADGVVARSERCCRQSALLEFFPSQENRRYPVSDMHCREIHHNSVLSGRDTQRKPSVPATPEALYSGDKSGYAGARGHSWSRCSHNTGKKSNLLGNDSPHADSNAPCVDTSPHTQGGHIETVEDSSQKAAAVAWCLIGE